MGQDLIPQDAKDPRSEAGDLNIESFTEKSGHKGVIPPGVNLNMKCKFNVMRTIDA